MTATLGGVGHNLSKSLCCTPETNVTLGVSYTSIKEIKISKIPIKEHFVKYLACSLQNCPSHKTENRRQKIDENYMQYVILDLIPGVLRAMHLFGIQTVD